MGRTPQRWIVEGVKRGCGVKVKAKRFSQFSLFDGKIGTKMKLKYRAYAFTFTAS
jgi:hypothetical protein